MKEKLKEMWKKGSAVFAKLNKKAVIAVCAVLILGLAVVLNFVIVPKAEGLQKKSDGLDVKLDLSDVSATIADKEAKEGVSGQTEDAFAQMTLSRRQARDEAVEVLTGLAESSTAVESMKTEAMNELSQIAKDIESEANIESLINAKGYEQCVAVVNGDTASVLIKTDGLMENEVAQISEIVWQQAGIHPDNLQIIESK
ncbi:MAG: SpoIIIAH-like family protein [Candidatus Avispirillum sp.]